MSAVSVTVTSTSERRGIVTPLRENACDAWGTLLEDTVRSVRLVTMETLCTPRTVKVRETHRKKPVT